MATYKQIQAYVKGKYGFILETCWIAHVKEICGLPLKRAWNRIGDRSVPCPEDRNECIMDAFRYFKMI